MGQNGRKVKFISCEVILDEVKDRIPGDWEVASLDLTSYFSVSGSAARAWRGWSQETPP